MLCLRAVVVVADCEDAAYRIHKSPSIVNQSTRSKTPPPFGDEMMQQQQPGAACASALATSSSASQLEHIDVCTEYRCYLRGTNARVPPHNDRINHLVCVCRRDA